jgi:hypothetical protein
MTTRGIALPSSAMRDGAAAHAAFDVCEAQHGHAIVMRRDHGRATTNTLWEMAEAASVAAITGAFGERAPAVTVTEGEIERLSAASNVEVAAAALVEPTAAITARLRGRRTELEVKVAFGDRRGTRVARAKVKCVVALPRASRCGDD